MNVIYFILGFFIPLPFFVNVYNWQLYIESVKTTPYPVNMGAPVPIGAFCLLLLGVFSVFSKKQAANVSMVKARAHLSLLIYAAAIFLCFSVGSVGFARVMSLLFPLISGFVYILIIRKQYLLSYTLKGYISGMVGFILFHFLSIVYCSQHGVSNKVLLFCTFFYYWIYQALISYSAVISYFACIFLISAIQVRDKRQVFFFTLIAFLAYLLLSYGQRKAAVLDAVFLFMLTFILSASSVIRRRVLSKKLLFVSLFICALLALLLSFSGFSERSFAAEHAAEQRLPSYYIFLDNLSEMSYLEVLLGVGGKWGGYSNLFVEILYRLGVLGLLQYLFICLLTFRLLAKYSKSLLIDNGNVSKNSINLWGSFTFLSLIASNLFNMNLQLPYYVINIVMLSTYYLKQMSLMPHKAAASKAVSVSESAFGFGRK